MLYTFYGDDFTGSTDVLEQLASNGISTVLFLKPPTSSHLARFKEIQAIGITGDSRSRSPEWMSANLPSIFSALKQFKAPINHYKICSTFDSSPTHGSIGRAIELGKKVFKPRFVPVIVAAPHLRRFVLFGNLFAAAPDGTIQRIDRHPMARHPVTPMCESDLRRHLSTQTDLATGLIDLITLQSGNALSDLDRQLAEGTQVILFDGIDGRTQAATGNLLWQQAQACPIFSASSSGLTTALVEAWRASGLIRELPSPARPANSSQTLLVLSGSCSPATAGQIRWALDNGFHAISIDPAHVLDPITSAIELTRVCRLATASLTEGRSTILYTALGSSSGLPHGEALGTALGQLLRNLLLSTKTRRVLLCGGDTSSHAVQQLDLYALTWAKSVQAGAPLCRAYSDDSTLEGLELVLKGGQVGTPDFFEAVRSA